MQICVDMSICIKSDLKTKTNELYGFSRFSSTHHNHSITHLKTNSDRWAPGMKVFVSSTGSSAPNEVRLMAKMRRKASIGSLLQIISCGSAPRMGSVQQLKTTCGVTFIA